MNLPRKLTGWLALATWFYSWSLFVEVRDEFAVGGATPPGWILFLLAFTTTALIAASGSAWMKFGFWPAVGLVAGITFAIGVLGTQLATMTITSGAVTLGDAFNAALRTRSAAGVVFVTAAPTLLVLAASAGLLARLRKTPNLEKIDV